MTRRERRIFTDEFKNQVVQLYLNGKPRHEIIKEYELSASAFDRWVKQHQNSGSFKEKDNRSDEENELIKLRKEVQQLKMENDIPKASSADHRTKVEVIQANQDRYSVSAMCKVLKITQSTYYYESKTRKSEDEKKLKQDITDIFKASRRNYGTRKIKKELEKKKQIVSRRRIGRIMKELGLVSTYTIAQFKVHKTPVNNDKIQNEVNRQFDDREQLEVVVSDLTYVRVAGKWNYVCILLDLYNREIIGYSAGAQKDAMLVYQAFATVKYRLDKISIFHTDRGNEFKNNIIDGIIDTFNIRRSLSQKGCPYDNAVAEATFKVFKTEFVYPNTFDSLEQLKLELFDYIHWYNHIRIHSSLDYMTPIEFKTADLKKVV
ncbi:IS3 family transposase [Acetobacterium sp. KB-1]|uniref:IS3 family transposase n=1 Tax=Acetobacterium sp. KB-1 TaxID=2184575 RepID=UPI000DBEB028|nr:IS3 family transposase [Acetobacterium sp. KB-1]AWW28427.1 IS3 family transposase [Acetobacterium sp. KB-1]